MKSTSSGTDLTESNLSTGLSNTDNINPPVKVVSVSSKLHANAWGNAKNSGHKYIDHVGIKTESATNSRNNPDPYFSSCRKLIYCELKFYLPAIWASSNRTPCLQSVCFRQKDQHMHKDNLTRKCFNMHSWRKWTIDHWRLHVHLACLAEFICIKSDNIIADIIMQPYNFMRCYQTLSLLFYFEVSFTVSSSTWLLSTLVQCTNMNFSDYTRKEESAYTYYTPSSSGVLHLANKGEVEARSKAVLEKYRRAWAEEFPLGYDGYPVSKDVCLIHVMGWEDDGSALKE